MEGTTKFPLLVRARARLKGCLRQLRKTGREGAKYHDLLYTSLSALRTSSDAFPPLQGVVGAVTSILEISQRVSHSKKQARELARRSVEVLELLADLIPDATAIPEPMLAGITRFQGTLEEIKTEMSRLATRGRLWRLKHLNRSEGALIRFNGRLDDASREFAIGAAVRVEACVHTVRAQISDQSGIALVHHDKQMLFLQGIIVLQTVFFYPPPVLAV
ncbi:hypothetical protein DFH07DRAFT_426002 [Mycena maculata]|uniref:Uncharacterized protein n=1 Tax=Mycena maculata TaxID=230809 RepID=A0AAD7JEJ4_9AGAR|nr:hypothetical protein DFH07DRAFT_426002 [Mycena maculata]